MSDQFHRQLNTVQKLIRHFYNGSLNFSLSPLEIETFTWDEQRIFLDVTVRSEVFKKYPVSAEFCRLYFKKIIGLLEFKQEVHDGFYTFLCTVLENNTQQEFCYKHYIIDNDLKNIITIKETKNMVVNGTTGMRTWQAALMLADFAVCNKDIFKGKNVLELGSGIGFTGITIAKLCKTNSIILTDFHNDVLKTICENVHINFPLINMEESDYTKIFQKENINIGVMPLDWNSVKEAPNDLVPDIIIGSDIIYDPSILKPLCNVIKTFFNKNEKLEVYIANVIRNYETHKSFLQVLDSMDLYYEEIFQTKYTFIEWDCSIQRCFLKIKCRKQDNF